MTRGARSRYAEPAYKFGLQQELISTLQTENQQKPRQIEYQADRIIDLSREVYRLRYKLKKARNEVETYKDSHALATATEATETRG